MGMTLMVAFVSSLMRASHLRVAVPARHDEPAPARHGLLELRVARDTRGVVGHELPRPLQQVRLDGVQQAPALGRQAGEGHEGLLPRVAPDEHALVLLDVLGADLQAQGRPPHLPVGVLEARLVLVAIVEVHAHAAALEHRGELAGLGQDLSLQSPLRGGIGTITTW